MKLLLKSIAFFASLALLCTSCAEDDTSDAEVALPTNTVVASTTIERAIAGNGKLVLDLIVPIDDNLKSYTISWTGSRTSSTTVTVAELYAYDGTDKVTINTTDGYIAVTDTLSLVAGDFKISVDNTCKSGCESATTSWDDEIRVYDSSTYTEHPAEHKVSYTDSGDLEITWGTIPAEFRHMTVSYYVESEETSVGTSFAQSGKIYGYDDIQSEYGYVAEGQTVTIKGVKRDSEYKFTSYFRPDAAIDSDSENVSLIDGETRVVPENDLAVNAPQNVSVQPGDGRIKVTWSVPEVADLSVGTTITGTTIQIWDTEDTPAQQGSNIVISDFVANDTESGLYINDSGLSSDKTLEAGTYVVKMWNTTSDGSSDSTSEIQEYKIDVYAESQYTNSLPTPTFAYGGNVLVSWDVATFKNTTYYSEFQDVEIEYNGYTSTQELTDLSDFAEFKFGTGVTAIKYTVTFLPSGGADEVQVVTDTNIGSAASTYDIEWVTDYDSGTSKFGNASKVSLTQTRAKINTAKGLKAFSDLVNGYSNTAGAIVSAEFLAAGYGFGRTNVTLAAYINGTSDTTFDMSPYAWHSVGTYAASYAESFDGNGVQIKGISMKSDYTDRRGLFGSVVGDGYEGGKVVIEGITLIDPIIEAWDLNNVGGIIGYASRVEIIDCHIKAADTGKPAGHIKIATETASSEKAYFGGIVGRIAGSSYYNEKSMVINCSNEMPIYNMTGGDAVGGIAGHVNETYIINCHNSGNITASSVNSPANYGGIVGHIPSGCEDFQIIGCSNSGNISGSDSYTGGIVGFVQAITSGDYVRIAACYNTGTIVSRGEFLGGIIGGLRKETYLYDFVGCYNYGQLYSSYTGNNGHYAALIGGVGYGDADELGTYAVDAYSDSYFVYNEYLVNDEPYEMANPATWAIGTNTTFADKAATVEVGLAITDSDQGVESLEVSDAMATLDILNTTYLTAMNAALETFYTGNKNQDSGVSSADVSGVGEYHYKYVVSTNVNNGTYTSPPTLAVID